jgi:NitT/TauT family transport system substrate-binding protein
LHGDPAPADALIKKDNPEMTQDILDQAREKLKSFAIVEGGDAAAGGIGAMTDARWKTFFDMASSHGVYPKTLDYQRAYTLQFQAKPASQPAQ